LILFWSISFAGNIIILENQDLWSSDNIILDCVDWYCYVSTIDWYNSWTYINLKDLSIKNKYCESDWSFEKIFIWRTFYMYNKDTSIWKLKGNDEIVNHICTNQNWAAAINRKTVRLARYPYWTHTVRIENKSVGLSYFWNFNWYFWHESSYNWVSARNPNDIDGFTFFYYVWTWTEIRDWFLIFSNDDLTIIWTDYKWNNWSLHFYSLWLENVLLWMTWKWIENNCFYSYTVNWTIEICRNQNNTFSINLYKNWYFFRNWWWFSWDTEIWNWIKIKDLDYIFDDWNYVYWIRRLDTDKITVYKFTTQWWEVNYNDNRWNSGSDWWNSGSDWWNSDSDWWNSDSDRRVSYNQQCIIDTFWEDINWNSVWLIFWNLQNYFSSLKLWWDENANIRVKIINWSSDESWIAGFEFYDLYLKPNYWDLDEYNINFLDSWNLYFGLVWNVNDWWHYTYFWNYVVARNRFYYDWKIGRKWPIYIDENKEVKVGLWCSWSNIYWRDLEYNQPLCVFSWVNSGWYGWDDFENYNWSWVMTYWYFENPCWSWVIKFFDGVLFYTSYSGLDEWIIENVNWVFSCDRDGDGEVWVVEATICWFTIAYKVFTQSYKLVDNFKDLMSKLTILKNSCWVQNIEFLTGWNFENWWDLVNSLKQSSEVINQNWYIIRIKTSIYVILFLVITIWIWWEL
jgi:hypothetical protein